MGSSKLVGKACRPMRMPVNKIHVIVVWCALNKICESIGDYFRREWALDRSGLPALYRQPDPICTLLLVPGGQACHLSTDKGHGIVFATTKQILHPGLFLPASAGASVQGESRHQGLGMVIYI